MNIPFQQPAGYSPSSCCNGGQGQQVGRRYVGNDADLAKEMNALTFEERERVYEDVHGVAPILEETPEFIERCIKEFDVRISKIPAKQRKAYNKAIFFKPSLETDTAFKLMFLRADQFDSESAAKRMVRYYEEKYELFGEEKLVKRITLDDLNDKDKEVLQYGASMTLPMRDQTNRPVMFFDLAKLKFGEMKLDDLMRGFWYQTMAVLEDADTQRKGICVVVYCSAVKFFVPGAFGFFSDGCLRAGNVVVYCLPCRFSSYHICYDEPRMEIMVRTIRVAIGRNIRLRVRAHLGSSLEIEYFLLTFGIQSNGLIDKSQEEITKMYEQYVQSRIDIDKRLDEREALEELESGIILYPKRKDVLIGRGTPYQEFSGNLIWSNSIYDHLDRYLNTPSRFEKTCITLHVVRAVIDSNGRFLTRAPLGWKVLDEMLARDKTAIAFRSRVKLSAAGAIPLSCKSGSSSNNHAANSPRPEGRGAAKRPRLDMAVR